MNPVILSKAQTVKPNVQNPKLENRTSRRLLAVALFLASAAACGKSEGKKVNAFQPPLPTPLVCHIGSQVKELEVSDTSGTIHSIEAYRGRIVVCDFWGCRCPYTKRSEKARRRLIAQYGPRGVAYLAIDSNRDEYLQEIQEYLADHRSSYTVLLDFQNDVLRRFNATRTPQSFVLDRNGVLRFVGSPFSPEQWAKGEPERADWLEAALDALLAGRLPGPATRPTTGSIIRRHPMF